MHEKRIILASSSPRRIEMMRAKGIEPVIMPADVDENLPLVSGMKETVMFLALKKAKAVETSIDNSETGSIIIAADTIVYKDEPMGKPADRDDCFRMLASLRNSYHYVATGVAIVEAKNQKAKVFAEVTKVYFKDFSDDELNEYLEGSEWQDKAGGYAIQGQFGKYIEKIEGDYNNVVGFPWTRIEKELDSF